MKCIILAAGYATRLYPLTENFPKPLLKVGEKPILDWLIDDIRTADWVDAFIVISNHRFAMHFEEWAAAHPFPITIVDDGTTTNDTRLGAVRDIQFAMEKLDIDDDALILTGDNVLDFSLDEKDWPEATDDMNGAFFGEILTETPPDGCYAVAVQDAD